jgi:hypothetical protein
MLFFAAPRPKPQSRMFRCGQFVSDAVAEKLAARPGSGEKARRKLAGNLSHLRSETARINQLMDQEFEKVEPEEWAARIFADSHASFQRPIGFVGSLSYTTVAPSSEAP